MKMKTEKEQFDDNVWYVLNQIKKSKRLGGLFPSVKGIPYVTSAGKNNIPLSDIDEVIVINYLVEKGAISILGKQDIMETRGEWEEKTRFAGFTYMLKLLEKFDDFFKSYQVKYEVGENSHKLILRQETGEVIYITPNNSYRTVFRKNDSAFALLLLMANYPHKEFSPSKLCKELDELVPRKDHGSDDDERRIRDAMRFIRKRLKLTENKTDDNLFIIDNKNFGINCDIEIRK